MQPTAKTIDIFCTVIDNYGDAGVCWRLVQQMAHHTKHVGMVRLWIDKPDLINKICPSPPHNVQVLHWDSQSETLATDLYAGDMVIEAFGCNFDHRFVARRVQAGLPPPVWINLEYLSAESWVEDCHRLPSLITHGACAGLQKTFVYPGFTKCTGGLLYEADLAERMARFDHLAWLQNLNPAVDWSNRYIVSLFCYPHAPVQQLLTELTARAKQHPTALLICAGHPAKLVETVLTEHPELGAHPNLHIENLPFMPQAEFDHLLWAGDFNCVRGEDSIVRAVAANKPLLWHIYPQDDNAHHAKLDAFLNVLKLEETATAQHVWNSINQKNSTSNTKLLHQHTLSADILDGLLQRSLVDFLLGYAELPIAEESNNHHEKHNPNPKKRL